MLGMVMMEQVNLDERNEKSVEENDWDEADGMKQEVDFKGSRMEDPTRFKGYCIDSK